MTSLVHDGPVAMVVLANGRYFAGGMLIAPTASLFDGLFDVLILDDVPKYTLLGVIAAEGLPWEASGTFGSASLSRKPGRD